LHLLDHKENVLIKKYLQHLCEDISDLLFQEETGSAIVFEGVDAKIPAALAIPLGFIVNELTTNAAKYGGGCINVRLESTSSTHYLLSVLDKGPGLPEGFQSCQQHRAWNEDYRGAREADRRGVQTRQLRDRHVHLVAFALPQPENNGT
jgi:two-component sensor histidine kinase